MRKPQLALLVGAGCFLAGTAAGLPGALATDAPPAPPAASSAPAAAVTDTGATLKGSVNPNGRSTSYAFQWGSTTGYGHETTLTAAGAGTTALPVSTVLSGLDPGTTYHYRVIAISSAGTSVGADESFGTTGTAPAASPAPSAATAAASDITQSGATLNGSANPQGQATSYYFEYGPTSDYGYQTAPASAGSGTSAGQVSATITGLNPTTTYHYRLVAVSKGGTALGADKTFTTTTPPSVSTGAAGSVTDSSARVNGLVDPEGTATSYWFEYGTTTAYGLQTAPASAGSGRSAVAVHALLSALTRNTTYHYRLVAQSAGGVTLGADQIITTGQQASGSHVSFIGREGFVSPGRVIGVEADCLGGTTACTGTVTLSHNGVVIGRRNFNIAPETGGFQNMEITPQGMDWVRQNRVFHLLPVQVDVTTSTGQHASEVIHLARWVWH